VPAPARPIHYSKPSPPRLR